MENRLFLSSPHMSEEGYEKKYISDAFEKNWIAPLGENVDEFEKKLASYVGISYAAALSSGTAAIHLALKAAGVGPGDVVFCQSLTFSATANPIIYLGAKPVFIDSDETSWNMSPIYLAEAFKKYQPKAVIVVHLYGLSADLDEIRKLCQENNVALIEDAAESLGSKYKGRYTGSIGDFGIYSFNGNKIITTSGGGMLVSNNKNAIEKVKFWATQSRDPAPYYQHSELGYNYRMSNILAGIGRGQLKVLEARVAKKRAIFQLYKQKLGDLPGINFSPENEWDYSNHWLSVLVTPNDELPKIIMKKLADNNIESRPIWKPMHLQPFFSKFDYVGDSVSEKFFKQGLCLPSDSKMTEEQQLEVIRLIKTVWK